MTRDEVEVAVALEEEITRIEKEEAKMAAVENNPGLVAGFSLNGKFYPVIETEKVVMIDALKGEWTRVKADLLAQLTAL